jgi:hypothetical protein
MVEAFSLRGLGRLAESWKQNPPFPGDNAFGDAIADYRKNVIQNYAKLADEQGLIRDSAAWFAGHRAEIEVAGLNPFAQAAATTILAEYERVPDCVEALGALNRWPGRSGVPIEITSTSGRRAAPSCRPPPIAGPLARDVANYRTAWLRRLIARHARAGQRIRQVSMAPKYEVASQSRPRFLQSGSR